MTLSVKYPTANTPTTGFNGVANNPTNAYTDDATEADFTPSKPRNDEDAHSWRGIDFSAIPAGATINSVTVKVMVRVSAANGASGAEWRVALFEDVTSAGALAPGVTTAIGAVQYTRGFTDTTEFLWDVGTLSTEPTLAQLQAANFGVRVEAAHGNTGTSYSYFIDYIEVTVDFTAVNYDGTATLTGVGTLAATAALDPGPTMDELTFGESSTAASSFNTASITPTADALVLVAVDSTFTTTTPTEPTLTGCGMTWVVVRTFGWDDSGTTRRLTLFRSLHASPSAGVLTFDFAGEQQSEISWDVIEFGSVDAGGTNGSAAVVQDVQDPAALASGVAIAAVLAAFASSNNATFGVGVKEVPIDAEMVADGNMTTIRNLVDSNNDVRMITQWTNGAELTVNWDWTTSRRRVGFAVEIAYASGTHDGAATLTGVGTLAATGALDPPEGAATLTGVGTLAGTGERVYLAAATVTGQGTLSAVGDATVEGAATVTGLGTLSAVGILVTVEGAATVTGLGTLSAAATTVHLAAATVTGEGTLVATGSLAPIDGAATLTGLGTLAATGERVVDGAATATGVGTISATGARVYVAAATLTGQGTLIAAGVLDPVDGTATLTGVGTLTASADSTNDGTATLTGVGTLAAAGILVTVEGAATLTGEGTLAAAGILDPVDGAATTTGSGTLAATGALVPPVGAASLIGAGVLTPSGVLDPVEGTSSLTGQGTLLAIAEGGVVGAATLTGVGTLAAAAQAVYNGISSVAGMGTFAATGALIVDATSSLYGEGSLTLGAGALLVQGTATVDGVGTLAADGFYVRTGTGTLVGVGTLTASTVQFYWEPTTNDYASAVAPHAAAVADYTPDTREGA